MCYIVIRGMSGSNLCFHFVLYETLFSEKCIEKEIFVFSLKLLSEILTFIEIYLSEVLSKTYIHLHVKYPLFSKDFNEFK